MAAHAVTGLAETIAKARKRNPHLMQELKTALTLGCWTEDLSINGWDLLRGATESGNFELVQMAAETLLPEMAAEWADLLFPSNREEWHRVKYRGDDK